MDCSICEKSMVQMAIEFKGSTSNHMKKKLALNIMACQDKGKKFDFNFIQFFITFYLFAWMWKKLAHFLLIFFCCCSWLRLSMLLQVSSDFSTFLWTCLNALLCVFSSIFCLLKKTVWGKNELKNVQNTWRHISMCLCCACCILNHCTVPSCKEKSSQNIHSQSKLNKISEIFLWFNYSLFDSFKFVSQTNWMTS